MIDARGHNLIFLLCVPRSGSSLSTVMLQNHSEVFATQEMWFLMSLRDLQLNGYRPYGGTKILNQFFNGVLPGETFESACRSFALEVYNGLLQSGRARMVVDKSPRYYYLLEFLDRLFPESKRIFLMRNPLSVAASYKKVHPDARDRFNLGADLHGPDFNIKMADLTIGLFRYADYFAKPNPFAYRLKYEELVAEPREQLEKLCGFLGLSYEEGMEHYGSRSDTDKAGLFYSMGVGDPMLSQHEAPHRDSVNQWKDVLDKREIELYCRALGADLFHSLGYSSELEEAQRLTGMRFDAGPDRELLERRTRQLEEASGCVWTPGYRMRTEADHVTATAPALAAVVAGKLTDEGGFAVSATGASGMQTDTDGSGASALATGVAGMRTDAGGSNTSALAPDDTRELEAALFQMRMTQRALEARLERAAEEKRRLRAKLDRLDGKISRLKSFIPFGSRLSRLASRYLTTDGVKS